MTEVRTHSEASAELEATVEFYESRLGCLGLRFLFAVESAIERIAAFPESGFPLDEGFRKIIVPGFPFSIVYQEPENHVLFLAVARHYRRPGYWLRRSRVD